MVEEWSRGRPITERVGGYALVRRNRVGRHGRGLAGPARRVGHAGRGQAGVAAGRRARAGVLPARGPGDRAARPPPHRAGGRGRRRLRDHGVRRRPEPAAPAADADRSRRRGPRRPPDRVGARPRPRPRRRPPRRQAVEHPPRPQRHRLPRRLRGRDLHRRGHPPPGRRHAAVHGARAAPGRRDRARGRSVRAGAHPARDARRRRGPAQSGGGAGRAAARAPGAAGPGGRARDRARRRRPVPVDRGVRRRPRREST